MILSNKVYQWTLNLNWSDKKVKTNNLLGCFEINSMFRTSEHGFFPTCHALITWLEFNIEGKIVGSCLLWLTAISTDISVDITHSKQDPNRIEMS